MTLEQSDYQHLVEVLAGLVERYRENPVLIGAILDEFRDMYRKIPIYPSIVASCLKKIVHRVGPDELQVGDEVVIKTSDGRALSGRIAEVGGDEIRLADAREISPSPRPSEVTVSKSDVAEAERISRRVLRREWPSLDFEVE
jgi:hypothetical protein